MSLLINLAKSLVPIEKRKPLKRALINGYYRFRGQLPFKKPLSRELFDLERSPRAKALSELDAFDELKTSAWLGLEKMAYDIVIKYRPKVIVELGTHMGLSALAMGLALRDLGEGGRLYAIDCWEGDTQAGFYDDSVYRTFLERIESLGIESTVLPLKMFFDEARDKVATPIDLLHIDGLHTWEAVNHDFDTYGPLVSPGGLVMFHDVNTHFKDLRKFWRGLTRKYDSHRIDYSHGLGLIRTKSA